MGIAEEQWRLEGRGRLDHATIITQNLTRCVLPQYGKVARSRTTNRLSGA